MSLGVEGARVVVLGLGVTGRVTARVLAAAGATVVASDRATDVDAAVVAELRAGGVDVETGGHERARRALETADFVAPSPGISPRTGLLAEALARGIPVVCELDLAQRLTDAGVVAVTGTKGKTTVCRLVERMLGAFACGNNEVPFLQAVVEHPDATAFAVECSSFRLYFCQTFHPHVAVVTNFAPDHLDWHSSLDEYRAAKARIARNQTSDDVFVYPSDQPELADFPADPSVHRDDFGDGPSAVAWIDGTDIVVHGTRIPGVGALASRGSHFALDAAAAAAAAIHGGATAAAVETGLADFVPDRHRLELVGERCGVRFYDDSMATNPFAALAAIRSFPSVVLIAGGRKKVPDLSPLAAEAGRVRAAVAIGEAADDVASVFANAGVPVTRAPTMRDAVRQAVENARAGDVVLLAPACASQDAYANYAERGDDFAAECRLLGVRM